MPRGDATAGRGYIEPSNEDARHFNVPMGENPFFPTTPAPEQAGSVEETAAPDTDASEDGEQEVVETQQATFDVETDRANGIDVNDPNYKHFQAAFTRLRQKDTSQKSDLEKQLEAMQSKLAQIEASSVKQRLQEPEQAGQQDAAVKLTFEGFPVPRLPEGAQLSGLEEEIVEIFKPMAQAVINDVARQQMAAMTRMQAEQTKAKISDFVSEIERSHPDKVNQVLTDLEEYAAVAKSNPDKWINFVKKSLSLNDEPRHEPAPNAQRLAQKQQSAVSRPTTSNGVSGQPKTFKSTREAIEAAFDSLH